MSNAHVNIKTTRTSVMSSLLVDKYRISEVVESHQSKRNVESDFFPRGNKYRESQCVPSNRSKAGTGICQSNAETSQE